MTAALEFKEVSYTYPGAPPGAMALERVSLRVEPGERLGVLGPNGGGKSTLLKIAMGLIDGYSGQATVFGMPPRRARRDGLIGYLPQRIEAELAFPISVRQTVASAAALRTAPWRRPAPDVRARVERAIDLVGVAPLADRPIGKLSGGQLQRVMIARAIATAPRILALDEPTVGVDAVGQRRFADLLGTLHRELGLTIVIVSHDIRGIAAACDRVACLARTLHFHDSPGGLTPRILAEAFSHQVEGVFGEVHIDAHAASECAHDHHHGNAHGAGGARADD
ncbi:MAG: metal ABC transporter ATP-binding protein [Phycisphaerales bacterium]|nr:metal ABC transporter ATP-binding protein [Phycisphaerales bacterium]